MEREARGSKPPGREMLRTLQVLYPVSGEIQDVTFLSEAPWGVDTHWRPAGAWGTARSVGCAGDHCEGCGKWPNRWQGYFAVWDHRHNRMAALVATEERWHGLRAIIYHAPQLRGTRWNVFRVQGANAGFRTWQASIQAPLSPLPPEPNLLPTLRRVYPEIAHLLIEGPEYLGLNGGAS